MKVVHVIKKIENIDEDIKELKKMEKSLKRNKSFTEAIYFSIEKQINILLGDRIKLLELKISDPPETKPEDIKATEKKRKFNDTTIDDKAREEAEKKRNAKKEALLKNSLPITMTQDRIDERFKAEKENVKITLSDKPEEKKPSTTSQNKKVTQNTDDVKILDIALEKGTVNKEEIEKSRRKLQEKEKKVKFFRENFPSE